MKRRVLSIIILLELIAGVITGCGSKEVEQPYIAVLPESEEQASIFVEKIDNLPDDFIKGMDISSLISEEMSGAVYKDAGGNECDPLQILADNGINYIRVRVWNDPFDADGNGYGGGNCTADTAAMLGQRAVKYGMKLCVDFHYSDFWADPNKQFVPKAWSDMDLSAKEKAIYEYTYDSLVKIVDSGANVGIVQVGNEINSGMAGETDFEDITLLLKSAIAAVKAINEKYDCDIKTAVHYTNIDNPDGTVEVAKRYKEADLDYDIFGVSFYPFWHGTMENMTDVLTTIHETYGVDTCVMETGYMYTTQDGDGFANSVSEADALDEYPVSVQGQANCVRDVCDAANMAGALGVFYWEGTWIPVDKTKWDECGSGWASKYAASYDPKDAGEYYGGCSWDNQAFFDKNGQVLDSLSVFKYINYGAKADDVVVLKVKDIEMKISPGDELILPESCEAIYNDTSITDGVMVTWDKEDVANVETGKAGEYVIHGMASDLEVCLYLTIADINYVDNPGFEDQNTSMWIVESKTDENPTDYQNKAMDAYSGSYSFHYWSEKDMEFDLTQTFSVDNEGDYRACAYMQGGDFDSSAEIYMYVIVKSDSDELQYNSDNVVLDGWVNWKTPVIENIHVMPGDEVVIGVYTKANAKAWATYDDFVFSKQ